MSATLQAAKDGDTKALEALMNKSFSSENVTVRVTNSGSLLKIRVSGQQPPEQSFATKIKKGIQAIAPKGFTDVALQAEAIGRGAVWQDNWKIGAAQTPKAGRTPVQASPKPAPKKRWYLSGSALFGFALTGIIGLYLLSQVASTVSNIFDNGSGDTEVSTSEPESEPPTTNEPELDYWQEALDTGYAAAVAANEASTASDWEQVRDQWNDAIQLLYKVPSDSPQYEEAQAKKVDYQANRDAAQSQHTKALNAWVPDGFTKRTAKAGLGAETEIAYRWSDQYRCTYGDFCLSMDVVVPNGCENSLYAELTMLDKNEVNVGMVNDSTSQVKAGEMVQLVFQSFNKDATKGRISEINCY